MLWIALAVIALALVLGVFLWRRHAQPSGTGDDSASEGKILLSKARIDAEAVQVAADAQAYKKEKILRADNALAQKLDAEIQIQQIWADAFAKRNVPQYVFGAGGTEVPVGSDNEVKHFMQLMTLDAAKRLSYDRSMSVSKTQ